MAKYNIHQDFNMLKYAPNLTNRNWTKFYNFLLRKSFDFVSVPKNIEASTETIIGYGGGEISVLIFKPKNIEKDAPCLIYYHGGAFFLDAASSHKESAFTYAMEANCVVVFPLFRLSVAHQFPTTLEDCYATLTWVNNNASKLGIDNKRIAVGGDSSGGSLAAVVSQMALDRKEAEICFQMLIYAAFDHTMSTKSMKNYTDTPFSNRETFEIMWGEYLNGIAHIPNYVSALQRENLYNLPTTYIETAEFDPLHDEGLLYAQKLKEAGINVILNETKGTIHAYDAVKNSKITIDSLKYRIESLKKSFKIK